MPNGWIANVLVRLLCPATLEWSYRREASGDMLLVLKLVVLVLLWQ